MARGFWSDRTAYERRARAARLRKSRLEEARRRGAHTEAEWLALRAEVGNRCVRCGIHASKLIGGTLSKDHIIPIACGGCDCIFNLQPMCRECNSSKGAQETRNWLQYRRKHGFGRAA